MLATSGCLQFIPPPGGPKPGATDGPKSGARLVRSCARIWCQVCRCACVKMSLLTVRRRPARDAQAVSSGASASMCRPNSRAYSAHAGAKFRTTLAPGFGPLAGESPDRPPASGGTRGLTPHIAPSSLAMRRLGPQRRRPDVRAPPRMSHPPCDEKWGEAGVGRTRRRKSCPVSSSRRVRIGQGSRCRGEMRF